MSKFLLAFAVSIAVALTLIQLPFVFATYTEICDADACVPYVFKTDESRNCADPVEVMGVVGCEQTDECFWTVTEQIDAKCSRTGDPQYYQKCDPVVVRFKTYTAICVYHGGGNTPFVNVGALGSCTCELFQNVDVFDDIILADCMLVGCDPSGQ